MKPLNLQLRILKLLMEFLGNLSGLRVHLAKKELLLTCADSQLTYSLAAFIGLKSSSFPFTYLGRAASL